MTSTSGGNVVQQYSCKCLNVRIRTAVAQIAPPDLTKDAAYDPVFVDDEGITVMHPQLTLRSRTRNTLIPGTTNCSRYTILICLLCGVSVYRVFQIVPVEVEGIDGQLASNEEWVEHEILKSPNGWIEVHQDCLTGNTVNQAEHSPEYSNLFFVLLPSSAMSVFDGLPTTPPASSSYLSNMKPLFLPPPFSPSDPAFSHLASLATRESDNLRANAEQSIALIVRQQISELERAELELKHQVQILWKRYKENQTRTYQERHAPNANRSSTARSRDVDIRNNSNGVSSSYGTPVAVKDFVPVPISLGSTASSMPRVSALSASLATSSFHHPRALRNRSESPMRPNGSSSRSLSIQSDSPTLVQSSEPIERSGSTVLQFRPNINDTINTAASYRWFLNIEEEMAEQRRKKVDEEQKQYENDQTQNAGPSEPLPGLSDNGNEKQGKQDSVGDRIIVDGASVKGEDEVSQSRGREHKGKRKVTFDVKPAIVTIQREVYKEREEGGYDSGPGEMVFELEEKPGEMSSASDARHSLPLIEPTASRPTRQTKARTRDSSGLFNALRPASLPAPSHIRPMRSQPGVDSSSKTMLLSLPRSAALADAREISHSANNSESSPSNPPSDNSIHRGYWDMNSKAWKTFASRQRYNGRRGGTRIPEGDENSEPTSPEYLDAYEDNAENDTFEEDEYNSRAGLPGSLPINITHQDYIPREVLSLASYQPQSTAQQVAAKRASSTAVRKRLYAKRDQRRSFDPGELDFHVDNDLLEEDEEDEDKARPKELEVGSRGRKHALQILKARSELPAPGMWRSLAS